MSEFGKGFVYNLFLFAKHWEGLDRKIELYKKMAEKDPELFTEPDAVSLWFNGAGDHFFGLVIPKQWEKEAIGKLATKVQSKALLWRMGEFGGLKEAQEFMSDCEKLMRMIDNKLGVKTSKAEYN